MLITMYVCECSLFEGISSGFWFCGQFLQSSRPISVAIAYLCFSVESAISVAFIPPWFVLSAISAP